MRAMQDATTPCASTSPWSIPSVPTEALGSIAFFDDMPDAAIEMYPNAIATLASTAIQVGYAESEHSTVVRDRLVGRVIRRVLPAPQHCGGLRSEPHLPLTGPQPAS
jgi:hypothetical protein